MEHTNGKYDEAGEKGLPSGYAAPEDLDIGSGNVLHQDLKGRHMQMIAM